MRHGDSFSIATSGVFVPGSESNSCYSSRCARGQRMTDVRSSGGSDVGVSSQWEGE